MNTQDIIHALQGKKGQNADDMTTRRIRITNPAAKESQSAFLRKAMQRSPGKSYSFGEIQTRSDTVPGIGVPSSTNTDKVASLLTTAKQMVNSYLNELQNVVKNPKADDVPGRIGVMLSLIKDIQLQKKKIEDAAVNTLRNAKFTYYPVEAGVRHTDATPPDMSSVANLSMLNNEMEALKHVVGRLSQIEENFNETVFRLRASGDANLTSTVKGYADKLKMSSDYVENKAPEDILNEQLERAHTIASELTSPVSEYAKVASSFAAQRERGVDQYPYSEKPASGAPDRYAGTFDDMIKWANIRGTSNVFGKEVTRKSNYQLNEAEQARRNETIINRRRYAFERMAQESRLAQEGKTRDYDNAGVIGMLFDDRRKWMYEIEDDAEFHKAFEQEFTRAKYRQQAFRATVAADQQELKNRINSLKVKALTGTNAEKAEALKYLAELKKPKSMYEAKREELEEARNAAYGEFTKDGALKTKDGDVIKVAYHGVDLDYTQQAVDGQAPEIKGDVYKLVSGKWIKVTSDDPKYSSYLTDYARHRAAVRAKAHQGTSADLDLTSPGFGMSATASPLTRMSITKNREGKWLAYDPTKSNEVYAARFGKTAEEMLQRTAIHNGTVDATLRKPDINSEPRQPGAQAASKPESSSTANTWATGNVALPTYSRPRETFVAGYDTNDDAAREAWMHRGERYYGMSDAEKAELRRQERLDKTIYRRQKAMHFRRVINPWL